MGDSNKLKEIFDSYDKTIGQVSKELINELKSESKTYGEVYKKINLFEKEIIYNNFKSQNYKFTLLVFNYIKEVLDKEKNDLPLTNRP